MDGGQMASLNLQRSARWREVRKLKGRGAQPHLPNIKGQMACPLRPHLSNISLVVMGSTANQLIRDATNANSSVTAACMWVGGQRSAPVLPWPMHVTGVGMWAAGPLHSSFFSRRARRTPPAARPHQPACEFQHPSLCPPSSLTSLRTAPVIPLPAPSHPPSPAC